jgi:spore coat polysaccharide biosynthesis protein SpsF
MTTAVIQARMSSSRLPGKVLMPILGKPMIIHQLERLSRSNRIEKIIVATSTDQSDDILARVLTSSGYEVHRGPLDDVLLRYLQVIDAVDAEDYVRITADCPLIDHQVVDLVIERHLNSGSDYTSNTLRRTYPRGLDVEIFKKSVLQKLINFNLSVEEREHVTVGIYNRPETFSLHGVEQFPSQGHHRWTVDTKADFDFVTLVYEAVYEKDHNFLQEDILSLLQDQPEYVHLEDSPS